MYLKIGKLEIRTGQDVAAPPSCEVNVPPGSLSLVALKKEPGLRGLLEVSRQAGNGLALLQDRRPHVITKAISWPAIPEDPMEQTRLSILINDMDSWFKRYNCLSITSLREYLKTTGTITTSESRRAFDTLYELHCKDFSLIHPEVLRTIPALYSQCFAGLRTLDDLFATK